ncbi:FxsA family protein [uncultured Abyssibacter sp.]|uniref:FxsA family protein n=1 Tax=uncultured Abyssibacter sp. TaxID=2320202 RepID=UPI0032B1C494
MGTRLLILLFVIPLAETWFLIKVGGVIGAVPTIALVVLTAVVGTTVARRQGLSTIRRIQLAQMEGRLPASEMVEGVLLLLAGVLLMTPGFFTDAIGFSMLFPQLRARLAQKTVGSLATARPDLKQPVVIEGDYERKS